MRLLLNPISLLLVLALVLARLTDIDNKIHDDSILAKQSQAGV
jgi:hypothetical protein